MTSIKLSGYTRSLPDISRIEHLNDVKSPTKQHKSNRESVIGKLLRYVSVQPTSKRRSTHGGSPVETATNISQIIEVERQKNIRRIKLSKQSLSEQFGLYIRDGYGTSIKDENNSLTTTPRTPGVFVSRFVPGGLAESSGLLSINDEIIEINGVKVAGKPLKEVYRLMVVNTQNLILTIKIK